MLLGAQGKVGGQEGRRVGGQEGRRVDGEEGMGKGEMQRRVSAWWLTACLCSYMVNQPHSEVGQ